MRPALETLFRMTLASCVLDLTKKPKFYDIFKFTIVYSKP